MSADKDAARDRLPDWRRVVAVQALMLTGAFVFAVAVPTSVGYVLVHLFGR